jgi:hypothetical protein
MKKIQVKEIKETIIGEIEYDISFLVSEGFDSEEDHAKCIIDELNLQSGQIFFGGGFFEVIGKTKFGKSIYVSQDGEFDMYGGPYEPKMKKPTITLNGKDIYDQVRTCFDDYGWFDSETEELDVTRCDIWGYIIC